MTALWSRLSLSSRFMCASLVLGLAGLLFSGCFGCDDPPPPKGTWVACVGNQPKLLQMVNGKPAVFDTTDTPFDPNKWDCSSPNSPPVPKPGQPDYKTGTRTGPSASARPRANAAAQNPSPTFLPRQLLFLPFFPHLPAPAATSPCESSFPDVITVNHPVGTVTRISTCPFQIRVTIPVTSRPLQVEFTPDGATAVVTSFDNAINFIDLASNKVTFTLNTDSTINPNGLAITPDGTRAYVTSFNSSNSVVMLLDLATRTTIKKISVDTYPLGAFLKPDGSELWVTFPFGQAVYVIDTLSNTLVTLLPIPQSTGVAFNSTGTVAYITSASGPPGAVVAVNTSTYKVMNSYTVGLGPTDIAISYGDLFLVVNNNASGSVSVIDLVTGAVNTTAVGNAPKGIYFVK